MEENWHLLTSSKTAIDIPILDATILIKKSQGTGNKP